MSYRIGSFNLQNLCGSEDEQRAKKFKSIAKIIRSEQFDIIALQEVLNEAAVNSIVRALGANRWEGKFVPSDTYASKDEGYAYIWNTTRVEPSPYDKNFMIYKRYTTHHRFGSQGLVRPPLVAWFRIKDDKGPFIEFRLINTHIAFSSSVNAIEEYTNTELRRMEFDILSKDIYRLISTEGTGSNRAAYTFLMGDYNLCISSNGPKVEQNITISQSIYGERNLITVQDKRTTVRKASENSTPMTEYELYANDYDHFTYDEKYPTIMKLEDRRVDALEKIYHNDLKLYRTEISDHVPIKLVINLKTK